MWKRDVSAGFTGFAAAMTLFAMAHYLAHGAGTRGDQQAQPVKQGCTLKTWTI
jgi:hypothetical protein